MRPMDQRFLIAMPLETHYERATCADVDCPQYRLGWQLIVPHDGDKAAEVRNWNAAGWPDGKRRHYREERLAEGLVCFTFPAGQPCFKQSLHRQPTGRDPLFVQQRGDNRRTLRPLEFNDAMNDAAHRLTRIRQAG